MSRNGENNKGGRPVSTITKRDLLAKLELASKGINPIDMIKHIHDLALDYAIKGRGYGENGDAGPQYLAVALKAASQLSEYYAPKIGPIKAEEALKMDTETDVKNLNAIDAQKIREVILNDPFAKKELEILEADCNTLPMGRKEPT